MTSGEITIPDLLDKYKGWIKDIKFLKEKTNDQDEVEKHIVDLKKLFDDIKKKYPDDIDYGEHLNWYEAHRIGKLLWKKLISSALKDIDADSKGNSEIFEFLNKATDFEELLYGLEDYYRDHTLHSLWVYFLGEYILREHLANINNKLNWYIFNDIEEEKLNYDEKCPDKKPLEEMGLEKAAAEDIYKKAMKFEGEFNDAINLNKDAIWCIIALCHDLGYSLSKLNKLNDRVGELLKFFDLTNIQQVGYNLEVEDQYIVSQFLDLMAMDVRMFFTSQQGTEPQIVTKCYRDDSTYWQLSRAMEGKQHGILSSYLIYKILSTFSESTIRGPAEEWGLDDNEVVNNVISGDILYAIAQHTFKYKHLSQLSSLADILILVDDIEEFSRYGRKMTSRDYHDTTANAIIKFKSGHPVKQQPQTYIKLGDDVTVEITYKLAKHLQSKEALYKFFYRKANDICKTYSLGIPDEHNYRLEPPKECPKKFTYIKCIKMVVKNNKGKAHILIHEDGMKNKIYLPEIIIEDEKTNTKEEEKNEKRFPEQEYDMACVDDKIEIIDSKLDKKLTLKEWLEKTGVKL